MSMTFSTNSGSLDSLTSSLRCGCSSTAFQIRPIVDLDSPVRSAIDVRDQCVAWAGVDSRVATTTSSTCSAVTDAGRPGRGSSTSPSQRACTNRRRHLPTVGCATRSRAATSVFDRPSAQPSTIRDRNASACELFRRRAHRVSVSRSSPVNTSSAFGRPRDAIRESSHPPTRFAAQHRR